jgi:uncharacterized lipoprotein YmbA
VNVRRLCWVALLAIGACSGASDIHYFTLSPQPGPPTVAAGAGRIAYTLDAVAIPEVLDRPQIVLRTGPNGVDVLDYDRWAAPLPDQLQRVLSGDLSSRLGPGAIVPPGLPSQRFVRRVTVSILEFTAEQSGQDVLDASWAISDPGAAPTSPAIFAHTSRHVATTNRASMAVIVATMSRLLGELANDIAASLAEQG